MDFEKIQHADGSWEVRFAVPQRGYTKREATNVVHNLNQAVADWEAKRGNDDMDADASAYL